MLKLYISRSCSKDNFLMKFYLVQYCIESFNFNKYYHQYA